MIPRSYKVMIALALLLAAGSMLVSAKLFDRVATTTDRTNGALCTFRADVQRRADDGEKFLREHPLGIPGIPVGTLRQSVNGQRRTVKALSALNCPPRSIP